MNYKIKSFRFGQLILENEPEYKIIWNELCQMLDGIKDHEIIDIHESYATPPKGLAPALNKLLKKKFKTIGWKSESRIFNDKEYGNKAWRLDFAKDAISVEVSFNHGEAIAWNLLKPTIASELNHVKKDIKTDVGIIICATKDLKNSGGFDNSTGEFEKFERYLDPLRNMLTVPVVIIGLDKPETFIIEHKKEGKNFRGIVKTI